MPKQLIGGTFAPPLSDEKLAAYEGIAATASPEVKDAMGTLQACVRKWWALPDSTGVNRTPHPSGRGAIIPLDDHIAKELWDSIPWTHELNAIQGLFDGIPSDQTELRNAAFHLLWHVKELDLDREPITNDLIKP